MARVNIRTTDYVFRTRNLGTLTLTNDDAADASKRTGQFLFEARTPATTLVATTPDRRAATRALRKAAGIFG